MDDDQFQSRVDDDLFADDFEPVEEPTYVVTHDTPDPVVDTIAIQPCAKASAPPIQYAHDAPIARGSNGLAQSRYVTDSSTHQPRTHRRSPKKSTSGSHHNGVQGSSEPVVTDKQAPPLSDHRRAPAGGPSSYVPGQSTAAPNRHLSGSNPRHKLSEAQLADKMEAMRIKNAETTRQFEQAQRDSRLHALAYAKGMEETRRKREEEEEKRRRGEEERKKMEKERERNRDRKLKSLGSWDQQKSAEMEDSGPRAFRAANGGVRGERRGSLGGHHVANGACDRNFRQFDVEEFRGRGRGRARGGSRGGSGSWGGAGSRGGPGSRGGAGFRGGGGRGRGGLGDGYLASNGWPSSHPEQASKEDDFPPLPCGSSSTPKTDTDSFILPKSFTTLKPDADDVLLGLASSDTALDPATIGQWDDEMAALDVNLKTKF